MKKKIASYVQCFRPLQMNTHRPQFGAQFTVYKQSDLEWVT